MSGRRFQGHGGEEGERALFTRRARALPAAEVPSLEAVLAAADAMESVTPSRRPGPGSAVILGLAAVAAACVGGLVVASARAAGDLRGRSALVADFDAGVAATPAFSRAGGDMCEPDDEGATTRASFVVASSDPTSHTGLEPEPQGQPERAPLVCEPELVCMP